MHLKNQEELNEQKELSDYRASHDDLTGLPDRSLLMDRLRQTIKQAKRHHNKAAVLFIDLDNFKPVNDTYGHKNGDKVLKIIARRFKKHLRQIDTVARLGGDEFVIVFNSIKQTSDINEVLEKLIDAVNKPISIDQAEVKMTMSIGISVYPDDAVKTKDLLDYADIAMYRAKDAGRNMYQYYNNKL